jgi:hypothetical protein
MPAEQCSSSSSENLAAPARPNQSEIPVRYARSEDDSDLSRAEEEKPSDYNAVVNNLSQDLGDRDADEHDRLNSRDSSQSAVVLQASYTRNTESSASSGAALEDEEPLRLDEKQEDGYVRNSGPVIMSEAVHVSPITEVVSVTVDAIPEHSQTQELNQLDEKALHSTSSPKRTEHLNFPRPTEAVTLDLPIWTEHYDGSDNESDSDKEYLGHETDVDNEDETGTRVIYYSNEVPKNLKHLEGDISLSSKFRKSQNQVQKPSPGRGLRSSKATVSTKEQKITHAIHAEEINPAFFGYAPDLASDNDQENGKKPISQAGSVRIPTLQPNLDELRANLKAHLKYIPDAKKRKTSPVKKAVPPHNRSDRQPMIRKPSPTGPNVQRKITVGERPEAITKVPSETHDRLKEEYAPVVMRSQSRKRILHSCCVYLFLLSVFPPLIQLDQNLCLLETQVFRRPRNVMLSPTHVGCKRFKI